jgi:hypothetical protein
LEGDEQTYNEELHGSGSSLSTVRMVGPMRRRCNGHVARMQARTNAYMMFVLKPDGKKPIGRMASSGMLRRVALVRTDVSEELTASFIRVTRIGELGTTLAITSNLRIVRQLLISYKPIGRPRFI